MMNRPSFAHPQVRHATCWSKASFGSMPSTHHDESRATEEQPKNEPGHIPNTTTLRLQTRKNPRKSNRYQGLGPAIPP